MYIWHNLPKVLSFSNNFLIYFLHLWSFYDIIYLKPTEKRINEKVADLKKTKMKNNKGLKWNVALPESPANNLRDDVKTVIIQVLSMDLYIICMEIHQFKKIF